MSVSVVLCWLYRVVACVLVAWPVARRVGRDLSGLAAGDGALWEAGGLWLSEAARWLALEQTHVARESAAATVATSVGWLVVVGGLVGDAAGRARPWRATVPRMGSLVLFGGLGLLLQVLVLMGAALAALRWTAPPVRVAAGTVAAVWWLGVSAFVDAARVARYSTAADGGAALGAAAAILARRPGLWWSGGWRWAIATGALVAAGIGAHDVAASGGAAVGCLALPAVGLGVWVILRRAWLREVARALEEGR